MNKRKHIHLWAFIFFALLAASLAMPALAQTPSADEINAVAKKLSCPTCTGINVADCPTETCVQWRTKIGEMLAEGRSEQEILDYFAARYGDYVLQVPPKRGFFVLVWVLPVIAILAGLAWLVYLMRGWSRQTTPATAGYLQGAQDPQGGALIATSGSPDESDLIIEDEYLQRVQQDLEKLS
jgi:cytochrome c-type biogenesis protein CcmH